MGVAREPGFRSKIAVISHADGVDPVGACVGPRGSRVRMVVSELRGEKIDIIPYNEEPARFVAKALSPARVREVLVDDETKEATVIVPDDQLSLAIGREGQNARLAAKLTGWKVDIKSETDFSHEDVGDIEEGEVDDGRCAAVLSAGRRCPNASLDGSRFCGLPQHQALARFGTNQVTVLGALSDEEVADARRPGRRRPARLPSSSSAPRTRARGGGRPRPTRRSPTPRRPRTPRRSLTQRRAEEAPADEPEEPAARAPRRPSEEPEAAAEPDEPRAGAEAEEPRAEDEAEPPRRPKPPSETPAEPKARTCRGPSRGGGAGGGLMAKKRVHEIAKARGLTSKEVLAKLQEAGVEVTAAASSVEEDVAAKALDGGGAERPPPRSRSRSASEAKPAATGRGGSGQRSARCAPSPAADGAGVRQQRQGAASAAASSSTRRRRGATRWARRRRSARRAAAVAVAAGRSWTSRPRRARSSSPRKQS